MMGNHLKVESRTSERESAAAGDSRFYTGASRWGRVLDATPPLLSPQSIFRSEAGRGGQEAGAAGRGEGGGWLVGGRLAGGGR